MMGLNRNWGIGERAFVQEWNLVAVQLHEDQGTLSIDWLLFR